MLTIILMILKIIGILLLSLLGILILLIMLILFVPIRYKAEVKYKKSPVAAAEISWFFKLLSLKFCYNKEADIDIRIFGFKINNSKKDALKKEYVKKETGAKKEDSEQIKAADTKVYYQEEIEEEFSDFKTESKEIKAYEKDFEIKNNTHSLKHTDKYGKKHKTSIYKSKYLKTKKEKTNFYKNIKNKILNLVNIIKAKFKNIFSSINNLKLRLIKLYKFLNKEANKTCFKFLLLQVKKVFFHILPKKIDITAIIGFEDVALTGNILAAAGLLYPIYKDRIKIMPDFTKEIIDIDSKFKGRIYIFYLLYILLKIWFDKNFKILYKNYRKGDIFA